MSSFFDSVFSPTSGEAPTLQRIGSEEEIESTEDPMVTSGMSTPSSSGASAAPANTPPTNKPKYGNIHLNTPWIGGPPKDDWSGTSLDVPAAPYCYRAEDAIFQMKSYGRRIEGNDLKFKRDDPNYSLLAFASDALSHMEVHGMDSVFYMTGVDSHGGGGKDLIRYHSGYTKLLVEGFIKECMDGPPNGQQPTYGGQLDELGLGALRDSGTWLMNSLDESLKGAIRHSLPPRPVGPLVWMSIVNEVQAESLARHRELIQKFENMKVSDFKGENVPDYCNAARDLLLQLERDRKLPNNHLYTIVLTLTEVSVQAFSVTWMAERRVVQDFEIQSYGKEQSVIEAMPNYVHFSHLLDRAKADYHNLSKQWGSTAVSKKQDPVQALTSKVDKLATKVDQSLSLANGKGNGKPSDGGKWAKPKQGEPHTKEIDGRTMHYCSKCGGGKGRWTNHPTKDHKTPGGGGTGSGQDGTKWNKPSQGEPHSKEIDGKMMHYCSKCRNGKGRWCNHLTKDHKTKEELEAAKANSPSGNVAQLELENLACFECDSKLDPLASIDPSVWIS